MHLECSTTSTWQCSTFLNPCDKLGFSNIDDLVLIWSGSPPPPPPPPPPIVYGDKNKWKRLFYKKYIIKL